MTRDERVGRLSGVGVRSAWLRRIGSTEVREEAAQISAFGFSAIWIGGGEPDGLEASLRALFESTEITIATSIASIWTHSPAEISAMHARLISDYGQRFLLGIGVSHAPLVAKTGQQYRRPVATMNAYLDALDGAAAPVPVSQRVIGALGPRMLDVSRRRAGGAHPFLSTVEHTRSARAILGPGPLLAPTIKVVLERDSARARATSRESIKANLALPNYIEYLQRLGFTKDDVENGGSDRLVDAVVAWGDPDAVAQRVWQHRRAGADHVVLDVFPRDGSTPPRDEWRRLAAAIGL